MVRLLTQERENPDPRPPSPKVGLNLCPSDFPACSPVLLELIPPHCMWNRTTNYVKCQKWWLCHCVTAFWVCKVKQNSVHSNQNQPSSVLNSESWHCWDTAITLTITSAQIVWEIIRLKVIALHFQSPPKKDHQATSTEEEAWDNSWESLGQLKVGSKGNNIKTRMIYSRNK